VSERVRAQIHEIGVAGRPIRIFICFVFRVLHRSGQYDEKLVSVVREFEVFLSISLFADFILKSHKVFILNRELNLQLLQQAHVHPKNRVKIPQEPT
jgi:hypothetical protein